jgi:sporulation protein YlmC with PRC-barrel domain
MLAGKVRASELIGKVIVSEERGKKFGEVADVSCIAKTGELMNILVENPTKDTQDLKLEEDQKGRLRIPFSSVKSIGDFVIISEDEIL